MLILRTPKGWTGPREVDGVPVENTWRSHQVPIADVRGNDEHVALLEQWMRSYGPEELFDANGRLVRELAGLAPTGDRRMSANPHTNGGALLRELRCPISARMRSRSDRRAATIERGDARARRVPSRRHASNPENFRLFGPDETASNRLGSRFRDDRHGLGGRAEADGRRSGPTGGSWRSCPSTSARDGSRATS